jgi:hypothetical protein
VRKVGKKNKEQEVKVKDVLQAICPYESGMVGGRPNIVSRTDVRGRIVAVLTSKRDQRSLKLIHPYTRCIRKEEVHEILLTDEKDALPGGIVNRVAAIAFMEFTTGGVLMEGDAVMIRGREIGRIAGFDEAHSPNHINIVLKNAKRKTGLEYGIEGGDQVIFIQGERCV